MFETLILLLVQVALIVGAAYLVIWVLGQLGIALPPMVVRVFWVVVVLIVVLMLWRTVGPSLSGGRLPSLR